MNYFIININYILSYVKVGVDTKMKLNGGLTVIIIQEMQLSPPLTATCPKQSPFHNPPVFLSQWAVHTMTLI